ncbi:hypothetical protein BJX68DRAFT_270631 [Aspergillus pseudodeflectus]|uniref:Uncharacterized protein n=1 Tax=Aspergillus pseudodeflectus TaxID=176178 RepID=A0ABR4JQZ6_9EURO
MPPLRFPPFLRPKLSPDFVLDNTKICLPDSLKSTIPEQLCASYENCHRSGLRACGVLKRLTDCHEGRFVALCPRDDVDVERWVMHSDTISRFREYYDEKREAMIPNAPSGSKIPRKAIRLTVNQLAYDRWANEFDGMIIEYVETVYELYKLARVQFEKHMQLARKENRIDESASRELYNFYHENFRMAMSRWEGLIASLATPSYEELVDEIYWAVRECVEGGEQLATEFAIRRTTVPAH